MADLGSKLRQDITSMLDAGPLFGSVASEVMRYLASFAMTAVATTMAVGVDSHGEDPEPIPHICRAGDHRGG